jgi:hypothetical protein
MTTTNTIINNLNINSNIDLTNNSYKDLDIELIIKEAVKYVIHKDNMPRDLKRVLCYYGIIDHFYPTTGGSDAVDDGDQECPDGMHSPPESVRRAHPRRSVPNDPAEAGVCQEATHPKATVEAEHNHRGS